MDPLCVQDPVEVQIKVKNAAREASPASGAHG